jgi:hypothetical protein
MARVTADGQTEGRIHALLSGDPSSSNVTSKLVVVTSPGQAGGNDQSVLELDAAQPSWTGNLKLGSMAGGDYLSLSFLQAVTPRLSLGGDASYIGVQSASAASYGARYAAPSWTAALQYSGMQGAVAASYRKVVTRDRVSLGAELQFSPQTMDSNVVLAGEFNVSLGRGGASGKRRRGSMMTYKTGRCPTIMRVAGSATSAMRKPQIVKRVRNDEA